MQPVNNSSYTIPSKYFNELFHWPLPQQVCIDSTNRCNLKCTHCHQSHFPILYGDFDLSMFYELMNSLNPSITIQLSSMGEPLLARHLSSMLNYLAQHGYPVAFVTNATLLDKYIQDFLEKDIRMTISLDAASEDMYRQIRGTSLHKVLDNIEQLQSFKKANNLKMPIISGFTSILSQKNIRELPQIIQLAKKLDIQTVIAYHQAFYTTDEFHSNSLYFDQVLSDKMHIKAIQLAKKIGVDFFHTPLFDGDNHEQRLLEYYICKDEQGIQCRWLDNAAIIGWHGVLYACCYYDRLFMGDLKHNHFLDIWNGPHYRKLRLAHLNRKPPSICNDYCMAMQFVDTSKQSAFYFDVHVDTLNTDQLIGPLPYSFEHINHNYQEAVASFENNQFDHALDQLTDLIKIDSLFFEVYHLIALIYKTMGNSDAAIEWYQKAKSICSVYDNFLPTQPMTIIS
ncbi:MAG: radical SAM protein [Desulfobacterales bacterium]|nr:radical SAM protein [Desulfobacterales bacterium]